MFDVNFYPTGKTTQDDMLRDEVIKRKVILEPQSGKADIVKRLFREGAKEVLGCELNPDLYQISSQYCTRMIGTDFLQVTSEQISHVDMIIMNPPFDKGGWHLLHAWKIAPPNCRIICLLNLETLNNPYTQSRKELLKIVNENGEFESLGDCFSDAERTTNVEVALVKMTKPYTANYEQEFNGFFEDEDPEELQSNGIMSYNAVRDLVNRYVQCIKIFDQQLETAVLLNNMRQDYFGESTTGLSISINSKGIPVKREEFKKEMQKSGWLWIFNKMNLNKTMTRGLREDINKFVEQQTQYPFTMKNIYAMLDMVVQTTGQRMDKAIIEAFDRVTMHHEENRYGLPGWKTNSDYLVGKKFILPNIIRPEKEYGYKNDGYNGLRDSYSGTIPDLERALCFVTGENWEEIRTINSSIKQRTVYGEWYNSHFFKYKGYKNGNMHFEFMREDVWAMFNQRVAKIKGYVIPEKREKTAYQKRQTYEKPVQAMA